MTRKTPHDLNINVSTSISVHETVKKKQRIDTKLEAIAAEFLVLGHLLLERITAYKAYVNFPGYDLIATATGHNLKKNCRLQVKSRYRTDWDGFIINNFDCDFVIFVALNRGFARQKKDGADGIKPPDFYILPTRWVEERRDPNNNWGKIVRQRLGGIEEYKDRWELISNCLRTDERLDLLEARAQPSK